MGRVVLDVFRMEVDEGHKECSGVEGHPVMFYMLLL